jgi:hypothetical protein
MVPWPAAGEIEAADPLRQTVRRRAAFTSLTALHPRCGGRFIFRVNPSGLWRARASVCQNPDMPHCTVKYAVRLIPKGPDAHAMNAIGIFSEERMPNELGEPGYLISRQLSGFSGSVGSSVKAMVTHGTAWDMDVQERVGPLEWDD